jgi:3-methyladenine DNA glycosylase/8-oxoguanine DNA glycosylase
VDSNSLAGKLVRNFGRPIETSVDGLTHLFPRPEDLADAELTPLGIPRKCAASIKAFARALSNQEFTFESFRTLQETIARLSAIEGVGEEMAHYIAMRASGEPDAFPLDYRSLSHGLWKREIPTTPNQLRNLAEPWRPWRAYAAMHLWAANAAV